MTNGQIVGIDFESGDTVLHISVPNGTRWGAEKVLILRCGDERAAAWRHDPVANAYYFELAERRPRPYKTQREVKAILDIAEDGTLAGVELVFGDLPPPPDPS